MKKRTKIALSITAGAVLLLAAVVGVFNLYFAVVGSRKQVGAAAGYAWSPSDDVASAKTQKLDMGDTDYKILVITDIHLKNSGTFAAWLGINYILDAVGKRALDAKIKEVEPNLILVLGDTVLTDRNDIETARFVKQMDSYRIPWACVFGNHDDEGRADKAKLVEELEKSEYGLFEYGPQDLHGAGNYVLELTRGGETVYALFMMDSGSSLEFEAGTDGIDERQTAWYRWNMEALEKKCGEKPKNMAFFHIPLPIYASLKEFEQGEKNEEVCFSHTDGGLVAAMLENRGTHVFSAHDHNNNFIANYHGIKLAYATKSSYNCYFKNGLTGGTLLTIDQENKVKEEITLF